MVILQFLLRVQLRWLVGWLVIPTARLWTWSKGVLPQNKIKSIKPVQKDKKRRCSESTGLLWSTYLLMWWEQKHLNHSVTHLRLRTSKTGSPGLESDSNDESLTTAHPHVSNLVLWVEGGMCRTAVWWDLLCGRTTEIVHSWRNSEDTTRIRVGISALILYDKKLKVWNQQIGCIFNWNWKMWHCS